MYALSIRFGAALAAIASASSLTACGPRPLPAPDKVELNQPTSVAIESPIGLPVVMARINGRGPYPFILDSGAMGSVVSEKLAHELGLPAIMAAAMGRPGEQQTAPGNGDADNNNRNRRPGRSKG